MLAVRDLKAVNVDENSTNIISDRLRTELMKTGIFRIMERAEMETILKEQGFQMSGACDEKSCIVSMGQVLGVKYVLVGTIGKVEQTISINIRIVDVATAEIVYPTSIDCKCDLNEILTKKVSEIALQLASQINPNISVKKGLKIKQFIGSKSEDKSSLSIRIHPDNATVALDSSNYGQGNITIDKVPYGEHTLEVTAQGHVKSTKKIFVPYATNATERVLLIKNKSYALSINEIFMASSGGYEFGADVSFGKIFNQNHCFALNFDYATDGITDHMLGGGLSYGYIINLADICIIEPLAYLGYWYLTESLYARGYDYIDNSDLFGGMKLNIMLGFRHVFGTISWKSLMGVHTIKGDNKHSFRFIPSWPCFGIATFF